MSSSEPLLHVKGYRAVKDRLAGDPDVADGSGVVRTRRWIQGMAAHTRNGDNVPVSLKSCVHRPQHIVCVEDVYILVHKDHMLQFGKCGKCKQRGLSLPAFVGADCLAYLKDGKIFASARAVRVYILYLARHGLLKHGQNGGFRRDACHIDMLLAGTDAGLHDRMFSVRYSLHL